MPRDSRLYMTFPIDFHRHPKVSRLSDAAFRAFVEANGESRIAESDGVIESDNADFLWTAEVMAELTRSHPLRPLVMKTGEAYVIRDYAEHQFTTADRDALSEKNRANGAKGGRPRRNPVGYESQPSGSPHKAESESESGLRTTYVTESQSLDNRAREKTDSLSPALKALAGQAGLKDVTAIRDEIEARTTATLTLDRAVGVARWLIDKSPKPVRSGQAYVMTCIRDNPAEIEQHLFGA